MEYQDFLSIFFMVIIFVDDDSLILGDRKQEARIVNRGQRKWN